MEYYALSEYVLSISIASIAAFIGITVIKKIDIVENNKPKVHISSIVFGAIICFMYLNTYFFESYSNTTLVFGLFVFLYSFFAVNTAINTICYREVSFLKLVAGSIIFASCISLVNSFDIWNEMVKNNIKMNLLLFISANLLLIGNTIATIRFIRQLRAIKKISIQWVIFGSIAIGIAFASIRFTLFSSITLFSTVDLFDNQNFAISNSLYYNNTLLPLTINVFGLVFLELFTGFVSDFHSKKQKELISETKQNYQALFDNQAIAIFSLNTVGQIVKVNNAVKEMLGFQLKELQEKNSFNELIYCDQNEDFFIYLNSAIKGESQMFETKLFTKSGEYVNVQITLVPQFTEDEIATISILAKDISDIFEAREEIRHMAYHDALTRLPNRRFFKEELDRRITSSTSDTRMAVCFLDLDRFKLINDVLGHQTGDELLTAISDRFRSFIDKDVLIARLGGDEFTFLFPNVASVNSLQEQVDEIIYQVQTPFLIANQELYITGSLGISLFPQDSLMGEDLMKFADMAMYNAKDKGKNTFEFYHNYLINLDPKQLLLEGDLRKAVKDKQFEVYYQPQINISTGKIFAVEALLRWNHPEEGVVGASDFIPLTEDNELINELGDWVLVESCKQVKIWQNEGYKELKLSVNVSFKQFYNQNFIQKIKDVLESTGYNPHLLDLEITESMAIKDVAYAINNFEELRSLGISISMDDFGTGYSSLNHLKSFPIDRLKIDGSLVQDIAHDPKARTIITTIIVMANNLDLITLAEKVETIEQLDFLKSIDCDEVQGYFYSKPLNSQELIDFLKDNFNRSLEVTDATQI
ncbi:sensor domain-containing protein [Sporosarcina sp. CAU 1771]